MQSSLLDLSSLSCSIPPKPEPEIVRDSLIDAVGSILSGDTRVVILEGPDGIGKTTLAAQLVRHSPNTTLSLFIRSASPWAYDTSALKYDLGNQLHWLLNREQLPGDALVDSGSIRTQQMRALRAAKKHGLTYVLDGLEHIPSGNHAATKEALGLMPFGPKELNFIISGNAAEHLASAAANLPIKPFQVPGFGLEEAARFFSDLAIDREDVRRLHSALGGNPSRLATVRRLIQEGVSIEELISGGYEGATDLIQREWEAVVAGNEVKEQLLACLTFIRQRQSIDSLADLVGLPADQVSALVEQIPFIRSVSQKGTEAVEFTAEVFRNYATSRLSTRRGAIVDQHVQRLLGAPGSGDTYRHLAQALFDEGRHEDVVDYLSDPNALEATSRSDTTVAVQQNLSVALQSAEVLQSEADLLRFGVQKSVLAHIVGGGPRRSEIDALAAAGRWDAALARSLSSSLKESRLQHLAALARNYVQRGLEVPEEIDQQIETLCSEVDPVHLGDSCFEVAADLLHVRPDLAMGLIEASTSASGEKKLELAFAFLSLQVGTSETSTETADDILSRIQDPGFRQAFEGASLLFRTSDAANAIRRLESMPSTSSKVYVARQWLRINSQRSDAPEVAQHALDEIVGSSEYSPNATVFRDLALALRWNPDHALSRDLIRELSGQLSSARHIGPTVDSIRFQALLVEAEIAQTSNPIDATGSLLDLFYYVLGLPSADLQATGLAALLAVVKRGDGERALEETEGLHSLIDAELLERVETLLKDSADQYSILRDVIGSMAEVDPGQAATLATRLNTQARRNQALLAVVRGALPSGRTSLEWFWPVMERFDDETYAARALSVALQAMLEGGRVVAAGDLWRFLQSSSQLRSAPRRAEIGGLLSLVAGQSEGELGDLTSRLRELIRSSLAEVEVAWHRRELMYELSARTREVDCELSEELLSLAEDEVDAHSLTSRLPALTYFGLVSLCGRCFAGLLKRRAYSEDDLATLDRLISRLPSLGYQAILWSQVAMRAATVEQLDLTRSLVSRFVMPKLQKLSKPEDLPEHLLYHVAPALYVAHAPSTLELLRLQDDDSRDRVIFHIARFLRSGVPPADPHDDLERADLRLTYEQVLDLCDLVEETSHDFVISSVIGAIARAVAKGKAGDTITREQRNRLVVRLRSLINEKLPDSKNIRHSGYVVLTSAAVASIDQGRSTDWDELVSQARSIENKADRALVLALIAEFVPNAAKKRGLLREAFDQIEQLPTAVDRIERWTAVARAASESDIALAREALRKVMTLGLERDDLDTRSIQRSAIDLAHRMDSDFAQALASMADDDPAKARSMSQPDSHRRLLREYLRSRVQQLEVRKALAGSDPQLPGQVKDWAEGGELALASLNASRIKTLDVPAMRSAFAHASELPFPDALPILEFTIESARSRFEDAQEAHSIVRRMFESLVYAADFAAVVTSSYGTNQDLRRAEENAAQYTDSLEPKELLVEKGARDAALSFLRDWAATVSSDAILVVDPYFGIDDIDVLESLAYGTAAKITVLCGESRAGDLTTDALRSAWVARTDEELPFLEVIIIGYGSLKHAPFHDRWLLSTEGGLSVGTSFNGLGKKLSEIREMSASQARERIGQLEGYLKRQVRVFRGERVYYSSFTV